MDRRPVVTGRKQGYRFGVRWIAENDEPDDRDVETIAFYISTLLLADLFGKDSRDVALDIIRERERSES